METPDRTPFTPAASTEEEDSVRAIDEQDRTQQPSEPEPDAPGGDEKPVDESEPDAPGGDEKPDEGFQPDPGPSGEDAEEPVADAEPAADAATDDEAADDEEPSDIAAAFTAAVAQAAEPEEQPEEAEDAAEEPAEEPEAEPVVAAAEPSPELSAAVDEAFAEAGVDEDEDGSLLDWQPGEWYVVHTYAGYENKVKTNLETRISSMNMEEKIFEVVIPVEDVMEVKSGKKQVVQRKVFPGYLLVRLDLDDESWSVVRNTPGVTGFVGSGSKPIPLSEREVDRVLQRKGPEERPKPRLEFTAGDGVRVVTGPFANFQGVISEIDADRSKLKVLVNIFGRETPVELGFDQVAKI